MNVKIKASVLSDFMKSVVISNSEKDNNNNNFAYKMSDSLLDFKPDGLYITGLDTDRTIMIKGYLSKDNFVGYEEGTIEIANNKKFISILNTYKNDEIVLHKENNVLKIMDSKSSTVLVLPNKIECFIEFKQIDTDYCIKLSRTDFLNLYVRANIIDEYIIRMIKNEGTIDFIVGNNNSKSSMDETSMSIEDSRDATFKHKFNINKIRDILSSFKSENLEFGVNADGSSPALKIEVNEDNKNIVYLVGFIK